MLPTMMASVSAKPLDSKPVFVQTTLFDLISAMQEATEPDQDGLVTHFIAHLMQSGRIAAGRNPECWAELLEEMAPAGEDDGWSDLGADPEPADLTLVNDLHYGVVCTG